MKKQLFTLGFLLAVIFQLQAQSGSSYSIIKPVIEGSMEASPSEYVVLNAGIKNLTNTDVIIVFNLVSKTAPEDWIHSLCGPQNCYTPNSSSKGEDKLKVADKNQIFEVNWSAKSAGTGEIVYEVYDKAKPDFKQLVKFKLTATMPTSVEAQALASSLKVYPNPAVDVLHIAFDAATLPQLNVSLTNAVGSIVYEQNYQGSITMQIPLSDLPQGIYQLSVKNAQSKVIASRKVIKN